MTSALLVCMSTVFILETEGAVIADILNFIKTLPYPGRATVDCFNDERDEFPTAVKNILDHNEDLPYGQKHRTYGFKLPKGFESRGFWLNYDDSFFLTCNVDTINDVGKASLYEIKRNQLRVLATFIVHTCSKERLLHSITVINRKESPKCVRVRYKMENFVCKEITVEGNTRRETPCDGRSVTNRQPWWRRSYYTNNWLEISGMDLSILLSKKGHITTSDLSQMPSNNTPLIERYKWYSSTLQIQKESK